jgi:sentrin-specific protease 8
LLRQQNSSTPYLSYHDVLLTQEDIDVVSKDDWLTDNIIAFWEEYLEREELSQFRRANIVLLRPSMTLLLMMTPDPLTLKEALPNFTSTTHIFLPINDCDDPSRAEGGSHWSLLLVSVVDGAAFHYDSMHSANKSKAAQATRKMAKLLDRNLSFQDLTDAPQQGNGTDCGVFVCLNMQHLLLKRLLKAQQGEKVSMSMGGREVDAQQGRKHILKIIDGFVTEGERRRS